MPTIEERIAKAKWAMDAYEDEETDVIDLLTDLMHYCHQNGPCFESSARMASIHFNEEVMKENHQPKETWTCCGGVEIDPSDRCPTCGDMY
ncbi:MAG: hypothetical protein KAJ10_03695 [Thermodesulfovibrionia bacterium]|nr:hypothetical protein [Thermodesulfovibrionia bacterium]